VAAAEAETKPHRRCRAAGHLIQRRRSLRASRAVRCGTHKENNPNVVRHRNVLHR
jgi:hypothetical protein